MTIPDRPIRKPNFSSAGAELHTLTVADCGLLVACTVIVLLVVPVPYLALAAKARRC